MRSLSLVAIGLAFVAIDFRTEALDLLPDPIGWVLVAVGFRRLGMNAIALLAGLSGVLSLSDVYLGFRYDAVDTLTGVVTRECPPLSSCVEVLAYEEVGVGLGTGMALAAVVGTVTVVLLLRRLESTVGVLSDYLEVRLGMRVLQFVVPVVWAVPLVAVVAWQLIDDGQYQPFWTGGLSYVAGITTVVMSVVVVVVARFSAKVGWSIESPVGQELSGR